MSFSPKKPELTQKISYCGHYHVILPEELVYHRDKEDITCTYIYTFANKQQRYQLLLSLSLSKTESANALPFKLPL